MDREIDVLAFDVLAQRKVKRALHQLWRFSAAEGPERRVTFIGCFSGEIFVDDSVVLRRVSIRQIERRGRTNLFFATFSQDDGVHAATDVGVDG